MDSQRQHTDPEHHTYGARGLVVGHPTVHRDYAGSNPVAHPTSFTEPRCIDAVGPQGTPVSVAQLVERSPEEGGVGGSIPSRGTKLKRKV